MVKEKSRSASSKYTWSNSVFIVHELIAECTIVTFFDYTAIMAVAYNYDNSLMKVQNAMNSIESWTRKNGNRKKIKIVNNKSVHTDFSNLNFNVPHLL